ncbi:leucine-rich melanocyte differentiation-associated protein [Strongylocentrotus purpuratus]|uniref:Leucine-rich melanocyte differentiation-associated protein n=1 Tax=Strongylocentrotus purpuratus TaxID=7668 RepID=A0A7M7NGC7_STRPU|nr:leucine-rich melanocyte differentiation-associated protein [Strongylocentrotus purpuratus]
MYEPSQAQENGSHSEQDFNERLGPIVEGTHLSYIEHACVKIPEELGTWYGSKVTRVDLSFNQITTLKGLERFPQLEELVMDNNALDDSLHVPLMPHLHTLHMNKNTISDINILVEKLQMSVPSLTFLSLLGNEACPNELSSSEKDEEDYQRYRYFVIYSIPTLRFLDHRAVSVKERNEAKRIGALMKVARPADVDDAEDALSSNSTLYSPLPSQARNTDGNPQGTYGRCKYVYYGRHSEGNRFIRNNDL